MKKFFYFTVLVIALSIPYFAFAQNGEKEHEVKGELSKPEIMASNLWSEIQDAKYQENWKIWPGKGKMYKGTHPHGAFLSTYVNDTAYKAVQKKEKELPYGSIIIKENYMPNKKLGAITVMQRIEGFNPDAGDWFWVKFAPNGKPMTMDMNGMAMTLAGKVPGCIGCHQASTSGTKFIMTQ
ncbi:MAG: cytochrome P460 family protein [Thermodesulfobacteriota bacterium]